MPDCVVCFSERAPLSTCACKGSLDHRCKKCEEINPVCLVCRRPNNAFFVLLDKLIAGENVAKRVIEQTALIRPSEYELSYRNIKIKNVVKSGVKRRCILLF